MTKKKAKPKRKVSKKKSKTKPKSKSKSKAKSKPKSKESPEVKALKEQQKKDLARLEKQQQAEIRRIEKARIAKDKKDKKDKAREKKRIAREKKIEARKRKEAKAKAKEQKEIEKAQALLEKHNIRIQIHPEAEPPKPEEPRSPQEQSESVEIMPDDNENEKQIAHLLGEKHIMPPAYCTRCHYTPCKRLSKLDLKNYQAQPEIKPEPIIDEKQLAKDIRLAISVGGGTWHGSEDCIQRAKMFQEQHKTIKVAKSKRTAKLLEWMKTGNMEPNKEGEPVYFSTDNGGLSKAGYEHHWKRENPNRYPVSNKSPEFGKFPCPYCFLHEAIEESNKRVHWSMNPYDVQLLEKQTQVDIARRTSGKNGMAETAPKNLALFSWIAFRSLKTEWGNKEAATKARRAQSPVPAGSDVRVPVIKDGKQKMTNLGTLYDRAMRNWNNGKDRDVKIKKPDEPRLHQYPVIKDDDEEEKIEFTAKFCGECGTLLKGHRFCKQCGADSENGKEAKK